MCGIFAVINFTLKDSTAMTKFRGCLLELYLKGSNTHLVSVLLAVS